MKQYLATHPLPDELVLSPKFKAHTLKVFAAMKPFVDYWNSIL